MSPENPKRAEPGTVARKDQVRKSKFISRFILWAQWKFLIITILYSKEPPRALGPAQMNHIFPTTCLES